MERYFKLIKPFPGSNTIKGNVPESSKWNPAKYPEFFEVSYQYGTRALDTYTNDIYIKAGTGEWVLDSRGDYTPPIDSDIGNVDDGVRFILMESPTNKTTALEWCVRGGASLLDWAETNIGPSSERSLEFSFHNIFYSNRTFHLSKDAWEWYGAIPQNMALITVKELNDIILVNSENTKSFHIQRYSVDNEVVNINSVIRVLDKEEFSIGQRVSVNTNTKIYNRFHHCKPYHQFNGTIETLKYSDGLRKGVLRGFSIDGTAPQGMYALVRGTDGERVWIFIEYLTKL